MEILERRTLNIDIYIQHWLNGSEEDISAAESLLENRHFRQALFFTHLSLEKVLKALIVKTTKDHPPKIHNLVRLAEIAGFEIDEDRQDFLRKFNFYVLQGRYPEFGIVSISAEDARNRIKESRKVLEWLKSKL